MEIYFELVGCESAPLLVQAISCAIMRDNAFPTPKRLKDIVEVCAANNVKRLAEGSNG